MLLFKAVIFLLISLLFASRLAVKYSEYREQGHTYILGVDWQGNLAILALAGVAILTGILFVMAMQNIYKFFSSRIPE